MRHRERTNLEQSLRNLDSDVIWHSERQSKTRKNVIDGIDRQHNKVYFGFIRRIAVVSAFLLIIAGSSVLFLSEREELSDHAPAKSNTSAQESPDRLPFYIGSQAKAEIKKIRDSGFDLKLPHYAPDRNVEISSVSKETTDIGTDVTILFMEQDKELFTFHQINIKDKEQLEQHIEQKWGELDFFRRTPGKYLGFYVRGEKEVGVITDTYVFVLSSTRLPEGEVSKILNSIDFSSLD